jgi:hypothetical protein
MEADAMTLPESERGYAVEQSAGGYLVHRRHAGHAPTARRTSAVGVVNITGGTYTLCGECFPQPRPVVKRKPEPIAEVAPEAVVLPYGVGQPPLGPPTAVGLASPEEDDED